jgi:hypothetical protein
MAQKIQKHSQPGTILLCFFGDATVGFHKPASLLPFVQHYEQLAAQRLAKPKYKVCVRL